MVFPTAGKMQRPGRHRVLTWDLLGIPECWLPQMCWQSVPSCLPLEFLFNSFKGSDWNTAKIFWDSELETSFECMCILFSFQVSSYSDGYALWVLSSPIWSDASYFCGEIEYRQGSQKLSENKWEILGIIWLQNFLVNCYDKNLRSENWGAALTFISYDMSTCVALCAGCLDSRTNPVFKFKMWVRMFWQSCTHICLMGNTITFDHHLELISTYNSTVKLFSEVESSKSWNLQKDHIYTYVWREIVNWIHDHEIQEFILVTRATCTKLGSNQRGRKEILWFVETRTIKKSQITWNLWHFYVIDLVAKEWASVSQTFCSSCRTGSQGAKPMTWYMIWLCYIFESLLKWIQEELGTSTYR
jgi:hypothetical protein